MNEGANANVEMYDNFPLIFAPKFGDMLIQGPKIAFPYLVSEGDLEGEISEDDVEEQDQTSR